MAKQNFLSGGYYGKLGMTVGQRWKNIRTIRSYVIPHNPRTPAQQANRGQFGDCVFFAQVGMQLNYKAPCFEAADKTAWNYRMSVARGLQDLGLTELERFPLYPLNFSVPYQITSANVTEVVDETHVKVHVVGNLPEKERVLTMLILLPGSEDWKERLAVCVGQNSSEDYSLFTFQTPEGSILEPGMQCRFISCDDTDSTTDLIASSQIDLEYIPIDEHEFDTTFVSLTRSGSTFTLTLAEPYQNGTNTVTIAGLKAVVNGVKTDVTPPEAMLINNNGNFAVVFDCPETENQNLWAFPSGCTIDFSEISSISSTVHATATEKTVAISSDDLTRTYDNRIASVDRNGATFALTYVTPTPTSTSESGTVTVHAVSKGAFVDYVPAAYSATENSVSFTQSYTDNSELLAFPSGSTAFVNLTKIGNGVTYTPYYTSASAVSDVNDLTRTYNNSVSSVSRSSATFTFAFTKTLPQYSSSSGSLSIRAVKDGAFATETVASPSLSRTSIGFTQSYSKNSEIYAFPSGSTVTPNITLVGSGVTYNPSVTTAQSVSNTDLTRTYDNSVSSVSRSSSTFTFAFTNTLPQYSSSSGSLSIRAVKDGAFATETVASPSLSRTSIGFTQSYSKNSEIYAFPNGSTVTPNITLVGSGVTYNPAVTTAQSVSNTDLTRTLSPSLSWSSSYNAFIYSLASGASISSGGGSVAGEVKNHDLVYGSTKSSTITVGYSGNVIKFNPSGISSSSIFISGDYVKLSANTSVVSNGVTYTITAASFPVVKTGTVYLYSPPFTSYAFTDDNRLLMVLDVSSSDLDFTSKPSGLSGVYPTTIRVADEDGGQFDDIPISSAKVSVDNSGEINLEYYYRNGWPFDTYEGYSLHSMGSKLGFKDSSGNYWYIYDWDLEIQEG